ncbi:hypothetical protein [Listeria booriae]|uniref:Uncharacterized protein n=1 Tax=Listeria booriae TaxID=1552123 RepID=A0A7X0ZSW8_9LIST|nr:hypothetical protein [Listeria booriae]MBC2309395.1 hypothetical protein [Listeria booriae]
MSKIEGVEKITEDFMMEIIPNAASTMEIVFDWEFSDDGADDILAICGNDVAMVVMEYDKHLEAALKERGTPYQYSGHEIFVQMPSLRDAEFLIGGFYVTEGVSSMSVFLMKEAQPKLLKVQHKKKTEWQPHFYLQDEGIVLFLMDDQAVALVCGQNDTVTKDFVEVAKRRLAGERVPLIDTLGEAETLEITDELLIDLNLPVSATFESVTGKVLSDPSIIKESRARGEINAIYTDELVQVITSEDLDDFFKKEKIPFRKENGWLVSEAIPEEKRERILSRCHNEALIELTFLFYGSTPKVSYEKKQNQRFWNKLMSSHFHPVFELNEGGKCIVLALDGQVAICYE